MFLDSPPRPFPNINCSFLNIFFQNTALFFYKKLLIKQLILWHYYGYYCTNMVYQMNLKVYGLNSPSLTIFVVKLK